jgi:hypothetical protein
MKSNRKFGIIILFVVLLIASMAVVPTVSALEDKNATTKNSDTSIKIVDIDGGNLTIDELNGISCSSNAGTYSKYYTSNVTYRIKVNWEYTDTDDIILKTAHFKLIDPDNQVVELSIYDYPGSTNSDYGTLEAMFTPSRSGYYHWTIFCNEGDESEEDIGDLILQ